MTMRNAPWFAGVLLCLWARGAGADVVQFHTPAGATVSVEGTVLGQDRTGAILLEGRDSQHFIVTKQDRISWNKTGDSPPPYSTSQLRDRLVKEFGPKFKTRATVNYVICHSTSSEFAMEAGKLFERALAVFMTYFKTKGGFTVEKPKQPLVAIICSSREEYLKITAPVFGDIAGASDGLYSPQTNRLYLFNAFGGPMEGRLRSMAQHSKRDADTVSVLLKERNISVVIHEGIHQIAYNCGFHSRTATQPLWLVEGMAMFFETPDLDRRGGWGGVGTVNRERLEQFQKSIAGRSADALNALVIEDAALRGKDAIKGYAHAWAFTYYLNKAKSPQYMQYLKIVNARPALQEYTEEDRLRDFRTAFGRSPEDMEMDFRRYITRLNPAERRR